MREGEGRGVRLRRGVGWVPFFSEKKRSCKGQKKKREKEKRREKRESERERGQE